jgi:tetratricopeptide (TPR) repeat protein
MKYELKPISPKSITAALAKADRYRYLNEPEEAESICTDILAVEPENQLALRMLGLAITDQFRGESEDRTNEAAMAFAKLNDPYERAYYDGILHERRAKAQLDAGYTGHIIAPLFEHAMKSFAAAEKIRPAGNDDSLLRWNRCVRLLESLPAHEEADEDSVSDGGDMSPMRR